MKKNIKVFLCLLAIFIISLGINVKAVELQWVSQFDVLLPIHKTDEAGKNLEGLSFTLKDFNNTISYSSSDVKDGDYLISSTKNDPDTLDLIINSLPSDYKNLILSVNSWDDVQSLINRDDVLVIRSDDYGTRILFVVPFKLEESIVPEGYQKQDLIVTGLVSFDFEKVTLNYDPEMQARSNYYEDLFNNGVFVYSDLTISEFPNLAYGYFEYDSSVDYANLYKKINKNLVTLFNRMSSEANTGNYYSQKELRDELLKLFEEQGYNTKDVVCPAVMPVGKKMDLEDIQFSLAMNQNPMCFRGDDTAIFRFDESISNCYCVLQVKNKRKNITINPATASTIGIITLIVIGSVGFITSKKLRKND